MRCFFTSGFPLLKCSKLFNDAVFYIEIPLSILHKHCQIRLGSILYSVKLHSFLLIRRNEVIPRENLLGLPGFKPKNSCVAVNLSYYVDKESLLGMAVTTLFPLFFPESRASTTTVNSPLQLPEPTQALLIYCCHQ